MNRRTGYLMGDLDQDVSGFMIQPLNFGGTQVRTKTDWGFESIKWRVLRGFSLFFFILGFILGFIVGFNSGFSFWVSI